MRDLLICLRAMRTRPLAALGAATALLGHRAAMACTAAVETEIGPALGVSAGFNAQDGD